MFRLRQTRAGAIVVDLDAAQNDAGMAKLLLQRSQDRQQNSTARWCKLAIDTHDRGDRQTGLRECGKRGIHRLQFAIDPHFRDEHTQCGKIGGRGMHGINDRRRPDSLPDVGLVFKRQAHACATGDQTGEQQCACSQARENSGLRSQRD